MFKVRALPCLFFLFFSVLIYSSPSNATFTKTKIAVLDFELHGNGFSTEGMGGIVSEWFTTSLVKDGRFDVVERAMLNKVIAEQQLGLTGAVDSQSASKIGKILGVKIVITGSVLRVDDIIEINSRIINVETGSIVSAESAKCGANTDLQLRVEQLTNKIVKNFPLTGYIVKRDDNSVYIDLGKRAGLKTGMVFLVFKEGEIIKHPKTGVILDVEQIEIGTIKITNVSNTLSQGEIVEENEEKISYGQSIRSVSRQNRSVSMQNQNEDQNQNEGQNQNEDQNQNPIDQQKEVGDGWNLVESVDANLPKGVCTLTVSTTPVNARVRILNIGPKYKSGMQLDEGDYHIELSKSGHDTISKWVTISSGKHIDLNVEMKSTVGSLSEKTITSLSPEDRTIAKNLQSKNIRKVLSAAKKITRRGAAGTSPNIFNLVEKRLLKDYKKENGRAHTDAMAWLCKALAVSHNTRYKKTLKNVADNAPSMKLTLYASKSMYTL